MSNELYYRDEHGDILTEDEVEARFTDMLDETHDKYAIGEIELYPSEILMHCDPVAYRCYLSDFTSEFEELTEDELDEEGIVLVLSISR